MVVGVKQKNFKKFQEICNKFQCVVDANDCSAGTNKLTRGSKKNLFDLIDQLK